MKKKIFVCRSLTGSHMAICGYCLTIHNYGLCHLIKLNVYVIVTFKLNYVAMKGSTLNLLKSAVDLLGMHSVHCTQNLITIIILTIGGLARRIDKIKCKHY